MTADPITTTRDSDVALPSPRDVLVFWFEQLGAEDWFQQSDKVDNAIASRFKALHEHLAREQPDAWTDTPEAMLALIVALDQFPRNIWRGSAHAFATDPLALRYARRIRDEGLGDGFSNEMKLFAFLPFEHSEDRADQNDAVRLIEPLGGEYGDYAIKHREVIELFGRFPHRNAALGRESTKEEQDWLDAGGGF